MVYTSQAYHGAKATGQLVIARRNSSYLLEPAEGALYHIALPILGLVEPSGKPGTRLSIHLALRDDRLHSVSIAVAAQVIAVVALVGHDIAATLAGSPRLSWQADRLHRGHEMAGVGVLTR